MELVDGLDTIRNLVGEPPREIPISKDTMTRQQLLMQDWNHSSIAIIPFCYKCKTPLVWHTPPDTDVLFNCHQCSRTWAKGYEWEGSKRNESLKKSELNIHD
jgi:hypothetical protein